MASLEDLYTKIPTAQIAEKLGVDESAAQKAIHAVVPQLLGGLHEHAQDPENEAGLAAALDKPDTTGDTIANQLFGGGDQAPAALSPAKSGVDQGLVQKLLPILLPIVLSYLSEKSSGKGGTGQGGGGAIGELIGGILGGASGGKGGGGAIGDILGSVLGGASAPKTEEKPSSGSGGLFGKILGGLVNRNK